MALLSLSTTAKEASVGGEKRHVANETGWIGSWLRVGSTGHDASELVISEAASNSFKFSIDMQSGGHVDGFEGKAAIKGNQAFYSDKESGCVIKFILHEQTLSLKKSEHCLVPPGCEIDGDYRIDVMREIPSLKDLGIFETHAQEEAFRSLVKEDFSAFEWAMQLIAEEDDLDQLDAVVHSGFVRGLANVTAAIIMIDAENKIWSAVLDNDTIYYHTNDPDRLRKIPRTIERWRGNFLTARVIYASAERKQKK